jgi:hypothetical protein
MCGGDSSDVPVGVAQQNADQLRIERRTGGDMKHQARLVLIAGDQAAKNPQINRRI